MSSKHLEKIAYLSNRKVYTCFINFIATSKETSFYYALETASEYSECIDLLEELYQSTESDMSDEDPIKYFRPHQEYNKDENKSLILFNPFLDYAPVHMQAPI